MSQQVNTAEKHVPQEDAAIAIPDEEIVSINYIFSYFIYILLLIYLYFISRNLPQIPLRNQKKRQKAWQEHPLPAKM